jgi:hypothetical protein
MRKPNCHRGDRDLDEFNYSVLNYTLAVYTTIYLAAALAYLSRVFGL